MEVFRHTFQQPFRRLSSDVLATFVATHEKLKIYGPGSVPAFGVQATNFKNSMGGGFRGGFIENLIKIN